jgi:hypothetical protein
MCCHCDSEWDYHGCHGYPGHWPGRRYYQELTPDERRDYLGDEKRSLERRLKEIEAGLAETSE